jgi:hypothetical protein
VMVWRRDDVMVMMMVCCCDCVRCDGDFYCDGVMVLWCAGVAM